MNRVARCRDCGTRQPATVGGRLVPCLRCGGGDLRLEAAGGTVAGRGVPVGARVLLALSAIGLVASVAVLNHVPVVEHAVPPPPPATRVGPLAATPPRLVSAGMTDADYPREAIWRGQEGTSVLRLLISPDGRVKECTLMKSSGSAILDAAACRGILSATFAPGRSLDGRVMEAMINVPITWRLPL